MTVDFSRRHFIGTVGAGLAFQGLPSFATGESIRTGELVKNRKINIACVGCGGKGEDDVNRFAGENIVGLCDVDFTRGAGVFQKYPQAKIFRDWREMIATLDDQIDAVVVSTPDHMHFPIAMMAMQMGKHVYVQKPMAHTVAEARMMLETACRSRK